MDRYEQALQKYFGFDTFRFPQKDIIASIAEGHDTIALLPTGTGKSLCFQLPSLMLPPTTVVISPLLALMQDQVTHLQKRGIKAAALTSDRTPAERQEIYAELQRGSIQFLYLSPEQLLSRKAQDTLLQTQITHLSID